MGTKPFKSYEEQVSILQSRGMGIDDPAHAAEVLRTHNYYRLSGYWHSMFSRTAPPSILSSRSTTSMLDCATRFLRTLLP